jgi:hypothetical protein
MEARAPAGEESTGSPKGGSEAACRGRDNEERFIRPGAPLRGFSLPPALPCPKTDYAMTLFFPTNMEKNKVNVICIIYI